MPLNPDYMIAPSLQEFFIDKDSGLPLTNGTVDFFVDNGLGSNTPKDVFQISGDPDFTYITLGNSLTLSAVGTFVDGSGNDIIPYYYPFDAQGNVQLYYIRVYNSSGTLQFTRQGWPNFVEDNVTQNENVTNYVPNGQLLLHNNIPAWSGNSNHAGQVPAPTTYEIVSTPLNFDVTPIAPGGWTFERDNGSSSTDTITFPSISFTESPTGNPPFAVQLATTAAGSDTRKDICIKFPNVNKFTSPNVSYNFYFEGKATSGGAVQAQILVIKYFGTGGANPVEHPITTVTIPSNSFAKINVPIVFTDNSGISIGTQGDDYVQIAIRMPPTSTQTVQITNASLTLSDQPLSNFKAQTNAEQIDQSTSGFLSSYSPTGSDLYLPLILTPTGVSPDYSQVGRVIGKFQTKANSVNNELLMDGSTFLFSGYSTLGIPYSRLGNYLVLNSPVAHTPMFGTGANFGAVYAVSGQPTHFFFNLNTSGGGGNTDVATSGFSISGSNPLWTLIVGAVPTAGTYWAFSLAAGLGSLVYHIWYSVDGVGTPPAPPTGASIEVALTSTDTATTTVTKTLAAVNQYQFVLSDLRGYFFRGIDPGATIDPDAASRSTSLLNGSGTQLLGAYLGSLEAASFFQHTHGVPGGQGFTSFLIGQSGGTTTTPVAGAGLGSSSTTGNSATAGVGDETRPVNCALNWFITY